MSRAQVSLFGSGGDVLPIGGGGGSPVLHVASTAFTSTGSGTALNHTGPNVSGSNKALVATLTTSTAVTGLTAVWDSGGTNQSMTLIASQKMATWDKWVHVFGLVAPTNGANTLAFAWTGTCAASGSASAVENADQSGGATTFANVTNTNGSADPSLTITGSTNHLMFMSAIWDGTGGAGTPSHTENAQVGVNGQFSATQRTAGAASVGMSWDISDDFWGAVGFSIKNA